MSDSRRAPRSASPPKYNAIVASARVMNTKPTGMRRKVKGEVWHNDAWEMFDNVPELGFGIGWIANGLSRVNLVGATSPQSAGDEPTVLRQPPEGSEKPNLTPIQQAASDLVSAIAGDANGQAQMLQKLATLLSVAGIGWVLIEGQPKKRGRGRPPADEPAEPDETWKWRVLSNDELRGDTGEYEIKDGDPDSGAVQGWRKLKSSHLLVKVWRSHPRDMETPDSPVRRCLPVLRQIVLLDDHVLATAQSRLAGAGILVLPKEIEFEPLVTRRDDNGDEVEVSDDFVEVLIDSMTTPIGDRGVAAAVVPLVIKVPGEYVDKIKHITFWSEFSEVVVGLRDSAVGRLALGMDMPPEIVTGVSGMNHWGAWRVQEEAITLHIIPLAEVICEALTIGYLRPALLAQDFAPEDVDLLLVYFDVSDLVTRPDKSEDFGAAYDRIEISGDAYRREIGAADTDKPSDDERKQRILTRLIDRAPTEAAAILPALGIDVQLQGNNAQKPRTATERDPENNVGETPDTDDRTADDTRDDAIAASMFTRDTAILEAADGLVHRALERAGQRLRTAASKNVSRAGGGPALECDDPTKLHCQLDAAAFAPLNDLLAGAWDRVPVVATRLRADPDGLTAALDGYVRSLIVTAKEHDPTVLARALELEVAA